MGNRPKLRHKFQPLTIIALLASIALGWTGCASKEAKAPQPLVTVQVATVRRADIQREISTSAVLYPVNEADIVPKISAPVEKFYVGRGQRVRNGELLATLENNDLAAAVAQAQGVYEQAQAAYATATQMSVPEQVQAARLSAEETKQALDAAQKVYQSRQKLYQQGAIASNLLDQSRVAYVQARNQYEIAEAHLKALESVGKSELLKTAEAQLASAKGNYDAALAQLGYSQIHSPIDGVVTSSPLYPGQMASAGSPLITVMNISKVVARAYISPSEAASLHLGNPASISLTSPGSPGDRVDQVQGKVSVVSPAVDPNSTTVQVWVEAPNPDGALKPGSTVEVNMVADTVNNALVVPATSILTAPDGTTYVMVVGADNVAHQTSVKTGIREGNNVQILNGLEAGERVVTEGAYGLPDGTKVKY